MKSDYFLVIVVPPTTGNRPLKDAGAFQMENEGSVVK
jgi:hypothetical protein